jgi:hypothetical protein
MKDVSMNRSESIRRATRGSAGYNLVEVLIAMGILGSVLVSVFTLFVMGRYNVYSGRQMTQALAIGNHVLEDLAPLNKKMIYSGAFNIADTDTGATVTFADPSVTYANAKIRSTDATVVASPPGDISTETGGGPLFLTNWTTQLANKLNQGSVTVIMIPMNDPTNDPEQFATAQTMQVRVVVRWMERTRHRQIVLDTVKAF